MKEKRELQFQCILGIIRIPYFRGLDVIKKKKEKAKIEVGGQ